MGPDAYNSVPPRGSAPAWTRVYQRDGQEAHLHDAASDQFIACDDSTSPRMPPSWDESWLGTGRQDEYEHAAALPLCPACFARRERARAGEG